MTGGPVGNGPYVSVSIPGDVDRGVWTSTSIHSLGGVRGGFISGRSYTISFYAKSGYQTGINFYVTSPAMTLTQIQHPVLSGTWVRYVFRGKCTVTTASGEFSIMNQAYNGYTYGSVDIGAVQVEEGDITTGYSETTIGPITAANAASYIANAAIGSAHIGTLTANNLSVTAISNTVNGSTSSGGRIDIVNNIIRVYDDSNVLRVKIGYLL